MEITTTTAEIKALLKFASDDPARVNLTGIAVSSGRLAATNGHVIAVRGPDPRASWSACQLVPISYWEQAIAGARAQDEVVVAANDAGVTIRVAGRPEVRVPADSGGRNFPPIHEVIPAANRKGVGQLGIGGHYLALLPVIDKASRCKSGHWRMETGDVLDPILFLGRGRDVPWAVVIMPVRL